MRVQIHSLFTIKASLKRARIHSDSVCYAYVLRYKNMISCLCAQFGYKASVCVWRCVYVLAMCAAWFLSHANKRELQTRGDMWSLRADSRGQWVGGRGKAKAKAAAASQSIDVNEFGADAFHFFLFFFSLQGLWEILPGQPAIGV